MFTGTNIVITGGTGSFGKKCTQLILNNYKPGKLIIFSRDEYKQYEMAKKYPENKFPCIRFFLGDVRDKERLHRAFQEVDYIIHAAALKQIPSTEYNPFEAVKTNVIGAQNIIDAAIDQNVKKVIALSTDKAANPINLYGATKLCSDKLFVSGNVYSGGKTIFSVVRYGNVVGSRGSVIPLFLESKKHGKIQITDTRMTRFWISLSQGVGFVLDCLKRMQGGEVFVPKLPSMKIIDLANAIAPDVKHEIIGIRPGEKIHEIMISKDDAINTVEYDNYFVIKPSICSENYYSDGTSVADNFEYSSEKNQVRLSKGQIIEMINNKN